MGRETRVEMTGFIAGGGSMGALLRREGKSSFGATPLVE